MKTTSSIFTTQAPAERAILVGVMVKSDSNPWSVKSSLRELGQLAYTAGAEVVGVITQRLPKGSSYYLGKGKLREVISLKNEMGYSVAIFDDELSPLQQRNLEEVLQVKVIDRTALILDIFARRAHTRESQLQVELAQHKYLLPRLVGQWSHLERLGGGIGTRGPGESQLETDRRLIRRRIHRIEQEIEKVRTHRALYRRRRKKGGIPIVALVGYTNAGKSTLLNALTRAQVLVEDRLFATLDPVTRRLGLENGQEILLTDTVGFIQKLPPTVVTAFRATLEELAQADLLLHIVDITHKNAFKQCQTVERIIGELGLVGKPMLTVFNKIDLLSKSEREILIAHLASTNDRSRVSISAAKGWGIEELLKAIAQILTKHEVCYVS